MLKFKSNSDLNASGTSAHAAAGANAEGGTSPQSSANTAPATKDLSRRLLIVDDERDILSMLSMLFSPIYDVRTAESGARALEVLAEGFIPQVILADQRMPGMTGTEFLAQSIPLVPQTVRIVLSGYTDVQDLADSINRGNVYRFLTKPWRNADLLELIRACFEHYDLSEEKVALTRVLKELQQLNNEKNELLQIVAHDLKNPLSAIFGMGEAIQSAETIGMSFDEARKLGGEVCGVAMRMTNLIKNLLDMQQFENGTIELNSIRLDAAGVIAAVLGSFETQISAKNLSVTVDAASGLMFRGDEVLFYQALENLISNAIKYSPLGGAVQIRATHDAANAVPDSMQRAARASATVVRFEIEDHGEGIGEDDQQHLFEKFAKLAPRPTAGEESHGLGLAIVKKLVEIMDGAVWCVSAVGKGSTFIVEMPASS
jgi:two-component system, sensor histidine kinase and response regulator